jgi:hypothetical protein
MSQDQLAKWKAALADHHRQQRQQRGRRARDASSAPARPGMVRVRDAAPTDARTAAHRGESYSSGTSAIRACLKKRSNSRCPVRLSTSLARAISLLFAVQPTVRML